MPFNLREWFKNWITRHYTIQIPREPGRGVSNELGLSVIRGECPICCSKEGFFRGRNANEIFCGNPHCRSGFFVQNFGEGKVWAKQIENGPSHLYRWGNGS